VKISVLCVITAFEQSLMQAIQESRAVAEKLHDAVAKIPYVSKFTAASRGSPCDSTAFLLYNRI